MEITPEHNERMAKMTFTSVYTYKVIKRKKLEKILRTE